MAAALLLAGWPGQAKAQSTPVTIGKTLCQGAACGLQTVGPGAAVYYKITLTNTSAATATVTIRDALPAGFQLAGYGCAATAGPTTPLTASAAQPLQFTVAVPAAGLECVIAGTFTAGATSGFSNVAQIVAGNMVLASSNPVATFVNPNQPLPSNLSITKTADTTFATITATPQVVTYTITITNNGAEDLYLGSLLTIEDRMSLFAQSVVVNARFLGATCAVTPVGGGSACLDPAPVFQPPMPVLLSSAVPAPLVRWGYPTGSAGLLKAGHSIVLTVRVELSRVPGVACIVAPNADGADNHAYIVLTLPAATPGGAITTIPDGIAADNSRHVGVGFTTGATQVDPGCNAPFQPPSPVLRVTKVQVTPATVHPWGSTIRYQITVRNVSTNPAMRIRRILLDDWVVAGTQTPQFVARRMGHSCSALCLLNPAPPAVDHQFLGNADTRLLARATLVNQASGGLGPGQSATYLIDIRYSNPGCDSYPAINPKTIVNLGRVTGWTEQVGRAANVVTQTVQHGVVTRMRTVPRCPLIVEKTASGTAILFGNPNMSPTTGYQVTFRNPTATAYTMGTLGDMMRIRPPQTGIDPYAVQLRVDYAYSCVVTQGSVTGYPAGNPAGSGNVDTAYVTVTQLPQQGVRLIRNLQPVVFGPTSRLSCSVYAWVYRPPSSDPYCSAGELENAAVLDASIFYDPNTPWPVSTTPGMFASVPTRLPRCHNLEVNKEAVRPWTWAGGPLEWRLRVTNVSGAPVAASPGLIVTDAIDGGLLATSATTTCIPVVAGPACIWSWSPSLTAANPGTLNVNGLAVREENRTAILATAPPTAPPNSDVCNRAAGGMSQFVQPPNTLYFWKNGPPSGQACVRILATATLVVSKRLTNNFNLPMPATYAINVSCTNPNPAYNGPAVALNVAAGSSATVQHIPVGSTCQVSETPPPAPAGVQFCQNPSVAVTYLPGGGIPIVNGNSIAIGPGNNVVIVNNEVRCGTGTLTVIKRTTAPSGVTLPFSQVSVQIFCQAFGPNLTVQVPVNGQTAIPNVRAGSTCVVTEQPPAAVPGCTWSMTQAPGAALVIPPTGATVTISNRLTCAGAPLPAGTLHIEKTTIFPPGVPQFATVQFDVHCSNGFISSAPGPANGLHIVHNIPAPTICEIIERPPPAPAGCAWESTQTPPLTAALAIPPGVITTVSIANRLVCTQAGDATLMIRKFVMVNGSHTPVGPATLPAAWQMNIAFRVTVTCGANSSQVILSAANNFQSPPIPLAPHATCSIAELPSAFPTANCRWVPSYPQGTAITNATGTIVRDIYNTQTCP